METPQYDLVVALGGSQDRKNKSAQLVLAGESQRILFTGDPNYQQEYALWNVTNYGIAPPFISTDTITDVRVIQAVMNTNKWSTVAVVDSNYHLPRTQMLLGRIMKYSCQVTWIGVPTSVTWLQQLGELGAYIREFFTVWS